MTKKTFKFLAILLVLLTVISSFSLCFAEEATTEATTATDSTEQTAEEAETNQQIHNGDLYIFDSDVKMDQLVDGNVYIFGNNVEVTGQVNGNLFVCANKVSFTNKPLTEEETKAGKTEERCYVRYSIYACAKEVYYNGACNDLYVATDKLEMTYDSYVIRDVKAFANTTLFKSAIGRDVDLQTNTLDIGQDDQAPIVYGNFRYSASSEQEFKEGIVTGEVTYKPSTTDKDNSKSIGTVVKDIVITFLTVVVTALIINLILIKYAPDFANDMIKNSSVGSIVITCLKGLAIIAAGSLIAVLLLISEIGVKLGLVVILSLILIGLFATPITAIYIANRLKSVLKLETTVIKCLVIALIAIILQGITYIPVVGGIISFIVFLFGYGLLVTIAWPNKEKSTEEKQEKIAKKEAAKALKAEKKASKKEKKEKKDEDKK